MKSKKTDEELWQEALSVFEDNREAMRREPLSPGLSSSSRFLPHPGGARGGYRIAAVAVVVFLLGGLAWAAVRLVVPRPAPCPVCCDTIATPPIHSAPTDSVLLFADARLDSLLALVALHYGRTLCIRDTALADLRVLTKWHVSRPLSDFLESMGEFRDFRLTDERDTLFVTPKEEEGQP